MEPLGLEDNAVPARLYRYISWEKDYHKRLLKNNEIYLATASSFNDPFECRFDITWPGDPALLRRSLEKLTKRDFPTASQDEQRRLVDGRCAKILTPGFEEAEKTRKRELMDQGWGFSCFSESNCSLLMWSHYADSHRGLCVGLSSAGLDKVGDRILDSKGFGSHIEKVVYASGPPACNAADPPPQGFIFQVLKTKASEWSYEREYRFVVGLKDNSRIWRYANDALVEVILGCRMDPKHENEIRDILRKKKSKPQLFRAVMRKGEFALDFQPVEL